MECMPKLVEKFFFNFPFFHLLLIGSSIFFFLKSLNIFSLLVLISSIYLVPLFLWRLIRLKYPLKKGFSQIGLKASQGSEWMVVHRLQYLFLTFPFFEKVLILVPGAFSLWLRGWGSHIGKSIIWTPNLRILDRTDLQIGDYCFLGEGSSLSCHFIVRKDDKLILLYDKISLGQKVLLGAHTHIGPGARIKDQEFVPTYSKIMKGRYLKGNEGAYEL